MYKKTDTIIAKWEWQFQKLQHGLIFDEINPDVIENSENKNCNKTLLQKKVGPSQNKSYDKYKIRSLNEYVKNMVKKLRAITKHMNNNEKKKKVERPKTI